MVARGVGRRPRRAVAKRRYGWRPAATMQALYTSARCICCSSLGYWRCACRMHLPMAASLAALSCAETDDAKPAMESTTGSVRRYAFVCFMVLLLDAFPSGMRHQALSKGCRAPCKYATPTHPLAWLGAQQTSRRRDA